ncbi:hypothetical protein HYU14_05125 [Candidatus Woesearchaeota archaeon]|nr:hypothetical protein [Candidatus Woesearchaeota archaeon]
MGTADSVPGQSSSLYDRLVDAGGIAYRALIQAFESKGDMEQYREAHRLYQIPGDSAAHASIRKLVRGGKISPEDPLSDPLVQLVLGGAFLDGILEAQGAFTKSFPLSLEAQRQEAFPIPKDIEAPSLPLRIEPIKEYGYRLGFASMAKDNSRCRQMWEMLFGHLEDFGAPLR